MNFPTPFSGIKFFVAFPDDETLRKFIDAVIDGCKHMPHGKTVDGGPTSHMHNFAVDTSHRRVFGSSLLMDCAQAWMKENGGGTVDLD